RRRFCDVRRMACLDRLDRVDRSAKASVGRLARRQAVVNGPKSGPRRFAVIDELLELVRLEGERGVGTSIGARDREMLLDDRAAENGGDDARGRARRMVRKTRYRPECARSGRVWLNSVDGWNCINNRRCQSKLLAVLGHLARTRATGTNIGV